jgi:osmoprotectant transport system permease protein
VTGQGVGLLALLAGGWWALLAPLALLTVMAVWRTPRPLRASASAAAAAARAQPRRALPTMTVLPSPQHALHGATALAAAALLIGLVAFAGDAAARQAAQLPALARVSLGGGFWLAVLLAWAMFADALPRTPLSQRGQWVCHALLLLALALLLALGALDALSVLKEYANRRDVFHAALWRHLQIVATALAAALALGLPLGLAASRHARLARPLFALLNVVQTVPSIALFGLLIGPLAWLGQAWPGSGLQGIGLLPAVLALMLYSLLPIVHGVVTGLQQIPASVVDAANGMGMREWQRLRQVEIPLALPVWVSARRLTAVQLVGLAVVAALIGAGGLGAIIFQGLLSSALDLVLLGVLPVVALALAVDAAFRWLAWRMAELPR